MLENIADNCKKNSGNAPVGRTNINIKNYSTCPSSATAFLLYLYWCVLIKANLPSSCVYGYTGALRGVYADSIFLEYFKRDEMVYWNAKYIVWFAFFIESLREFIFAIYKQFQAIAFSRKDIGRDRKPIAKRFDEDERGTGSQSSKRGYRMKVIRWRSSQLSKTTLEINSLMEEFHFQFAVWSEIMTCVRHRQNCRNKMKVYFFIDVFTGAARDFFYDHCRGDMNFRGRADKMLIEYDSDATRLGVHLEWVILTIKQFMANQKNIDDVVILTRIVEHVTTPIPQCPPNFCTESNKIRFLRHALLMQSWAENAVKNTISAKCTFIAFVTALRKQLHQKVEQKSCGLSLVSSTLYRRYGRIPQIKWLKNREARTLPKQMKSECCASGLVQVIISWGTA